MFTRITLYKNCILTARNTEVFRTQELLETYLATLDKPYVGNIDIYNVYTTLNGTVTIDVTNFNGDFNYIKFEEFDDNNELKQTVYAFIMSFRLVNDMIVINYSTDIWHTYLGKWTLRDSLIVNSKVLRSDEPYELPLRYIQKGLPRIREFSSFDKHGEPIIGCNHKFAIVLKIQLFDLQSGGEPDGIVWEGFVIYNFLSNVVDDYYCSISPVNRFDLLGNILDNIQQWQNKKGWRFSTWSTLYYARIVKTYILPAAWLSNIDLFYRQINSDLLFEVAGITQDRFNAFRVYDETDIVLCNYKMSYFDSPVSLDEVFSFGTFTSQIPFEFDGIQRDICITASITYDTFTIYLKHNLQTIDITDNFYFEQDYKPTTPDVLAQREIARKQQTLQGITGIIRDISQVIIGGVQVGAGFSQGFGGNKAFEQEMGWNLPSSSGGNLSQITGGIQNIVGGTTGIVENIAKIKFANEKKYMTFDIANNFNEPFINAYYSLVAIATSQVANQFEVDKAIEEVGYNVTYFSNTLDVVSNITSANNVIKFSFVRLTGLSTEICEMIAKILTDGVKIWYTANV